MPSMNQRKFMERYTYALGSDFKAADGTPAAWAPNMPSYWGSESKVLKLDVKVSTLALSPDDALLAIGVAKAIHIYDVATLELRQVLEGHTGEVSKMSFSPKPRTGYTLVSSADDPRDHENGPVIIWWDLDDEGKDLQQPTKPIDVEGIAKKASDSVLEDLRWPPNSETSQALEVDFKTALVAAVAKKGLEGRATLRGSFAGFQSEVFSRDGKHLFSKLNDATAEHAWRKIIEIWDVETRTLLHKLVGHTDNIMWIGSSPDSKLVASIAWDGTVRIWSLETGQCLHKFGDFGGQMWAGAWSPDSKYLAFSQGSPKTIVYVYEVETEKEISRFEGIKHWARSIDWSPDGKFLASGADSGLLCVWDPMTGEEKMKWELKFDDPDRMMSNFISISRVKFVGTKLIFQSTEGTSEVYDFDANLKSQFTRRATDLVTTMGTSLTASHSGKFLVSADADKNVRIWDF